MPLKSVKVRELMTKKVSTLDRNDTLDMVDDVMELGRVRHIPVVDQGKLVGIVSQRDLFRSALAFAIGYGEKGRRTLLRSLNVKDVMNSPVVTTRPDATLASAAALMVKKKIGCLPVLDVGNKMIGILTETDVLKHVAGKA
jgi:CBS domain-containing protein